MVGNAPSQTAEAVAWMRASEQGRSEGGRILDDPYARLFLGPLPLAALAFWKTTGVAWRLAGRFSASLSAWVLTRHRYLDDCLLHALDHGAEQIVLLGAGYDTRAWRFVERIGDRPLFEVDFPATSRRKRRIVERNRTVLPPARPVLVEIDFQTEPLKERLLAAGLRQRGRTFFLWEGVSMYLTRAAVKETLTTIAALGGAGSEVAMDFWFLPDSPDLVSTARRISPNLLALFGEPITFGLHPEDCGPFLDRLGFRLGGLADAPTLERRYVRDGRRVFPGGYVVHAAVREASRGRDADFPPKGRV